MKTIRIIAEARLSDDKAELVKNGIVWNKKNPIATLLGEEIYFVSAYVVPEGFENFNLPVRS